MTMLKCPICERWFDWERARPVTLLADNRAEVLARDDRESDESWQARLRTAYRPCSGPNVEGSHYLPYDYADYRQIVIGMIGGSRAGKSHLLAAMIGRLISNDLALRSLGLRVGPLDLRTHRYYLDSEVVPLLERRKQLEPTQDRPAEFRDALRVVNRRGESFAVSFFDVAGEQLARSDQSLAFFANANALIFVVDPASIPRLNDVRPALGDSTFDEALRRLGARPSPTREFLPVPAVLVVGKADLIRFGDPLVDEWMSLDGPEEEIDLRTVERESADVYALLAARGAGALLAPVQECHRSTLHFASATNVDSRDGVFPEQGFRQRRVLKPLLALFAMTGVLDADLLVPEPGASP